jgi:hypothetical protein
MGEMTMRFEISTGPSLMGVNSSGAVIVLVPLKIKQQTPIVERLIFW